MPSANAKEHIQRESLGRRIWLYKLDLTMWGETPLYWVGADTGAVDKAVTFDGQVYSPFSVLVEGFALSTEGAFARPTFTASNKGNAFTALVHNNNDLKRTPFTRFRTYDRFLDDGAEPDADAIFDLETYYIEQCPVLNKNVVKFVLASAIDAGNAEIPAETANKDFCFNQYRVWNPLTSSWDYTGVTCDYTGTDMFDEFGQPTMDPTEDKCNKLWGTGCKLRFGTNPNNFTACPGMSKVRIK